MLCLEPERMHWQFCLSFSLYNLFFKKKRWAWRIMARKRQAGVGGVRPARGCLAQVVLPDSQSSQVKTRSLHPPWLFSWPALPLPGPREPCSASPGLPPKMPPCPSMCVFYSQPCLVWPLNASLSLRLASRHIQNSLVILWRRESARGRRKHFQLFDSLEGVGVEIICIYTQLYVYCLYTNAGVYYF